jgi:hypothetical protein
MAGPDEVREGAVMLRITLPRSDHRQRAGA